MPFGIGYGKRAKVPNRKALTQAVTSDIIDPDDPTIDPEMRKTITGEAARRVGAAGVQVRTRNPFDDLMASISGIFKGKRR